MQTTLSVFGFEFNLHGTAAIVVTVVFSVIFAVCFFGICCRACGCKCPRRRGRWRPTRISTTVTTRTTTTTARTTAAATSNGRTASAAAAAASPKLDPRALSATPSFVYTSSEGQVEKLECAVCLAAFKDGEKGRLLVRCDHRFHAECIDKWFQSHSTCPVCRSNVHVDTTELPV